MSGFPHISVEDRNLGMLQLDEDTLEPGYVYRWCRDAGPNIAKRRRQGYELCRVEEGIKGLYGDEDYVSPDGTIRYGDLVLMRARREHYEERQERKAKFATARLGYPEKKVRRQAEELGVETFTDRGKARRASKKRPVLLDDNDEE